MRTFQRVTIIGRVGQDPEIRYLPDGSPVASLSLATDEGYKDKSGEKIERTEWHRVAVFGPLAEVVQKYVTKGDPVLVEGKLRTRKWAAKDGTDRYTTEVVLSGPQATLNLLSPPPQGQGQQAPQRQAPQRTQGKPQQPAPQPELFDDDIPF